MSKNLGDDDMGFISEIVKLNVTFQELPIDPFSHPKLLGDLFKGQKSQKYPFQKRKGLLLPGYDFFRCFSQEICSCLAT